MLTNVRPWGGAASDLVLRDGVILAVENHDPQAEPRAGSTVVEGNGRLVLPSFSDVHVHLDSTRIGLPFRPHSVPEPRTYATAS